MPETTVVRSLMAASGPSPSRLRNTATAPCGEARHCAEMSDSWQNAANRRAEASRVMITATFARLPSSPCNSSSNDSEFSASDSTASASFDCRPSCDSSEDASELTVSSG